MTRSATVAPALDGFHFIDLIASGASSNVFSYQQLDPNRMVAIKVLDHGEASVDPSAELDEFDEASMMARLPGHPSIVRLFDAGRSDDGRRYLVMEHHGANYLDRASTERFSVAEVLRIGVLLAGAVETAHQSDVLHGDIKPANVVTSVLGRPALTDFGVSSLLRGEPGGEAGDERAATRGLSIPWAAPEVIASETPGVRADVYSLAATLSHLLTGRPPYSVPGHPNRAEDHLMRIGRLPLPPLDRSDVPIELERCLATAMSADPPDRHDSAASFGHELRNIESLMGIEATPLDVPRVATIARPKRATDEFSTVDNAAHVDAQSEPFLPGPSELGRQPRVRSWPVARSVRLAAPTALVLVALALLVTLRQPEQSGGVTPSDSPPPKEVGVPSSVEGLAASVEGQDVRFSWRAPTAASGDEYVITFRSTTSTLNGRTSDTSVSFMLPPNDQFPCLDVIVRRTGAPDSGLRSVCLER